MRQSISLEKYVGFSKSVYKKKREKFNAFDSLNYLFLAILSLICFFPIVYELLLSIASKEDYLNSNILVIPRHLNFDNYIYIFGQGKVGPALLVSLLTTVAGTIYAMILTSFGAYAFTRKRVPGIKVIFALIIFTMFFGGGIIPFYLTVKGVIGLNNLWCLIVPFGLNSFNLIILKNFFSQVPYEVIESARLEGASEFTILFRIVVPLSKPGLSTILLWYVISFWDAWYWPSFFLSSAEELYPLALVLRNLIQSYDGSNPIKDDVIIDGGNLYSLGTNAATIMISVIPILIFYPFLHKYFTKGQLAGSIKG